MPDSLHVTAELCRAIVDATSDAVIVADRSGAIRLWNRGAELLFGHAATDVLGQSLDLIIPERLRPTHWEAFGKAIDSGRIRNADRVLTTRSIHKNGRRLYVDLSFGLVKDENGDVTGAFAIGRDCTERYVAARATEARLAELQPMAHPARRP